MRLTIWMLSTYGESYSRVKLLLLLPAAFESLWLCNYGGSLWAFPCRRVVWSSASNHVAPKSWHNISVMPRRHYFTGVLPVLWLLHSFCILYCDFPLDVSGVTDAPFRDEHTMVIYGWHFDQLSVIVSVCWKKKLLWWWVRAALSYGYTDNYLLNHFRMAVVSSL